MGKQSVKPSSTVYCTHTLTKTHKYTQGKITWLGPVPQTQSQSSLTCTISLSLSLDLLLTHILGNSRHLQSKLKIQIHIERINYQYIEPWVYIFQKPFQLSLAIKKISVYKCVLYFRWGGKYTCITNGTIENIFFVDFLWIIMHKPKTTIWMQKVWLSTEYIYYEISFFIHCYGRDSSERKAYFFWLWKRK